MNFTFLSRFLTLHVLANNYFLIILNVLRGQQLIQQQQQKNAQTYNWTNAGRSTEQPPKTRRRLPPTPVLLKDQRRLPPAPVLLKDQRRLPPAPVLLKIIIVQPN